MVTPTNYHQSMTDEMSYGDAIEDDLRKIAARLGVADFARAKADSSSNTAKRAYRLLRQIFPAATSNSCTLLWSNCPPV